VGKPKDLSSLVLPPAGLQQAVSHLALAGLEAAVCIGVKQDRAQALKAVNATVMEALSGQARGNRRPLSSKL
jgi:polyribonucleotide nucleotidyltransferase